MNKNDVFWDQEQAEQLRFKTVDEAMIYVADTQKVLPKKIILHKFVRDTIDEKVLNKNEVAIDLLENINDQLAEHYADPEDPSTDLLHDDELQRKAIDLVESFFGKYVSWTCHKNGEKVEIDTQEWIRKHSPSLLEEVEIEEV